jgi:hypothetical protein
MPRNNGRVAKEMQHARSIYLRLFQYWLGIVFFVGKHHIHNFLKAAPLYPIRKVPVDPLGNFVQNPDTG